MDKTRIKQYGIAACALVWILLIAIHYNMQGTAVLDEGMYDIFRQVSTNTDEDPLIEKTWTTKASILLKPLASLSNGENLDALSIYLLAGIVAIGLIALYTINKRHYLFPALLAISPLFIMLTTSISDDLIAIVSLLLLGFCIQKKKYTLAILPQLLASYMHMYYGFIGVTFLGYEIYKKRANIWQGLLFLGIAIANITFPLQLEHIGNTSILEKIFLDFGAFGGLSIPITILTIVALLLYLRKEPLAAILLIEGILFAFFNLGIGLVVIHAASIYLISRVIEKLEKEKWQSGLLKQLSVILIFCSVLFAGIVTATMLFENTPSEKMHESFTWIQERTPTEAKMLSHPKYGDSIAYFAERKVLLNTDIENIQGGAEKYNDTMHIFSGRNSETTGQLLEKHGVQYIFVTKEMKEGLVWNKENQGLLFVVESSESFKKIFENSEVEIIWYNQINEGETNNTTNSNGQSTISS